MNTMGFLIKDSRYIKRMTMKTSKTIRLNPELFSQVAQIVSDQFSQ